MYIANELAKRLEQRARSLRIVPLRSCQHRVHCRDGEKKPILEYFRVQEELQNHTLPIVTCPPHSLHRLFLFSEYLLFLFDQDNINKKQNLICLLSIVNKKNKTCSEDINWPEVHSFVS